LPFSAFAALALNTAETLLLWGGAGRSAEEDVALLTFETFAKLYRMATIKNPLAGCDH
jgi:hypothetical protein